MTAGLSVSRLVICFSLPHLELPLRARPRWLGYHDDLAVGRVLQRSIGIHDTIQRKTTRDLADDCGPFHGQRQRIGDEARQVLEAVEPARTVVLGNEHRPGEEVPRIDRRYRTGELAVADQASAGCEKPQAGPVGSRSDGVEDGGGQAPVRLSVDGFSDVFDSPVDDVGGPRGADAFHAFAARDTDDADSTIGEESDEHSTDGSRRCPYDRGRAFGERPDASETRSGQSGNREASAVLEAECIGKRDEHGGRGDDAGRTRPENRGPAHASAGPYRDTGSGLQDGAGTFAA